MVENWQLPGAFQVPDMSRIAAISGASAGDGGGGGGGSSGGLNTDSQGAADWDYFNQTMTRYTNIYNANRAQSLRERMFVNDIRNQDRDFTLREQLQNANIAASDRDYLLRKDINDVRIKSEQIQAEKNQFILDQTKKEQALIDEAIKQAPNLMEKFEAQYGKNAGYNKDYQRNKADFIMRNAANPAYKAVLDQIFLPYDRDYQTFADNKLGDARAVVESLIMSGKYNSTTVGGVPLPEVYAKVKQDISEGRVDEARAGLMAISDELKPQLQMRDLEGKARLGVAMSQLTGQPMTGGKVTAEGKTEITVGGGTTARAERPQTLNKENLEQLQQNLDDANARVKAAEDELATSENDLERKAARQQPEEAESDRDYFKDIKNQNIEQMGRKIAQVPVRTPTAQPPSSGGEVSAAPASVLSPRPGLQAPSFPAGSPQRAAPSVGPGQTPVAPMTTGKQVSGYMNVEGGFVPLREGQQRIAKGEQLTPVYSPQDLQALAQGSTEVLDFVKAQMGNQRVLSPF